MPTLKDIEAAVDAKATGPDSTSQAAAKLADKIWSATVATLDCEPTALQRLTPPRADGLKEHPADRMVGDHVRYLNADATYAFAFGITVRNKPVKIQLFLRPPGKVPLWAIVYDGKHLDKGIGQDPAPEDLARVGEKISAAIQAIALA